MKIPSLVFVLSLWLLSAFVASAVPKKIVFISHKGSHGRGSHEYAAGSRLIGHWLEKAYGEELTWEHHIDWPADSEKAFAGASTVVFFCSGGGKHLVNNHVPEFDALMRRGVGLACLHYGVEVPIGPSAKGMLNWMGGYFEANWSVNPTWIPEFEVFPEHPVANGIEPFRVNDEWYFHMRFRGEMENVIPVLSARAPEATMKRKDGPHSGNPAVRKAVAAGEPQHVAWAYQRGDDYGNGRGFGFTGLHFHWNFENDNFRKTVLNGVAWTAGLEVPAGGVESETPSRQDLELSMDGVLPGDTSGAGAGTKALFESEVVTDATPGNAVAIDVAIPKGSSELYLAIGDGGNGRSHDWADWAEARLVMADGSEEPLTELGWKEAKSGSGKTRKNLNAGGKPMKIDGKAVDKGIGSHAPSIIGFDLPKGVVGFRARGGLDDGGVGRSDVASVQFLVYNAKPPGIGGKVRVATPETEAEYVKKSSAPGGEAKDAVASLDVHEGLAATLFASEPLMASPSSFDIDHRGRAWVCEVVNYRRNQGRRPGGAGDRILILEDTDGDGAADKQTVFHEGHDVDSAHGICVLGDRALVSAGEEVFYLIDEDGDDRADRKELLFTKTGGAQHDHGIHAVHFGPDGRLYFNFGNAAVRLCDEHGEKIVDLAGNVVEGSRKPYQQGMVFRCEMDGSNVETLGWNFRNNWEVAVDSFGTVWQSDNDDDGNKGVRINEVVEFGNYGYRDEITGAGWRDARPGMSRSIPERHWHLNDPGVVPNFIQTGAGSPTGITVYEGDLLPERFRGQVIHCDAGPNVCRAYVRKRDGAGYTAEMVDILTSTRDRWFRPADVSVAPDGSLFVADWYDPGVGGHGMGDIEKGRIFRVAPKGVASGKWQVASGEWKTVEGAMEMLLSPNEEARYLGWTALAGKGKGAEKALRAVFQDEARPAHHRARALWLLARVESGSIDEAIADGDADIRITGLRAARQLYREDAAALRRFTGKLVEDADPRVRREAAVALRFDSAEDADELWAKLALRAPGGDRWYLEGLGIGADLFWDGRLAAYLPKAEAEKGLASFRDVIWRSRGEGSAAAIASLLLEGGMPGAAPRFIRALHFQPDGPGKEAAFVKLFREGDAEVALAAAGQIGKVEIEEIPGGEKRLEALLGPVRGTAEFVNLASRLGLTGFGEELADYIAANPNTNEAVTAAKLMLSNPAGARAVLRDGGSKAAKARAAALAWALGKTGDRSAAGMLKDIVSREEVPAASKRAMVEAMALSSQGGKALLALAKEGKLDKELHFLAAASLSRNPDVNLRSAAATAFDVPASPGAEKLPPLPELIAMKGDAEKGRAAFVKATCSTCHVVKDEGIDFGPNLSEIGNKLSREAFFEAILHPSNAISEGFNGVELKMKSNESFIGYITGETDEAVTLRMAGGVSQDYKVKEIRGREALEVSLMPPGLVAILEAQELVDLVAWMQSLK